MLEEPPEGTVAKDSGQLPGRDGGCQTQDCTSHMRHRHLLVIQLIISTDHSELRK